jgi:hypothetical protein
MGFMDRIPNTSATVFQTARMRHASQRFKRNPIATLPQAMPLLLWRYKNCSPEA